MHTDIVIIGGGPIGCWVAIQLKKRNPSLEVQVYERHREYKRDHMMSIKRASFTNDAKRTRDEAEAEFYQKIATNNNTLRTKNVSSDLQPMTRINTLVFESILKEECERLGVRFTYKKILSPEEVIRLHPECQRFVAADGAHSLMRTALLGEDSVDEKDLLYSVDVKYEAEGQATYLYEPTYDKLDMIVVETIGSEENGKTNVALRFLVDEKTYNELPEATFKKPLNREAINPDSPLYDQLNKMQSLRQQFTNEKRIPDTERITKVRLSQYVAKKLSVTSDRHDMIGWFFVGDAAMGMPFYRSINSGLQLGSRLAAILSKQHHSPAMQSALYNALRPLKTFKEFGMVALKLSGIKLYKNILRPILKGAAITGSVILVGFALLVVWILIRAGVEVRLM